MNNKREINQSVSMFILAVEINFFEWVHVAASAPGTSLKLPLKELQF